jgi:hypothetical protein
MKYLLPLSLLILASCSTPALKEGGQVVELVRAEPSSASCVNLGPVVGKGGGMFGGAWISDQKLLAYAANDLRNNGANLGATHIVIGSPQMGQTSSRGGGGTTSTATYSGIAYKCS